MIVFENDGLIAVNKPPGIGFHVDEQGNAGILQYIRSLQAEERFDYRGSLHPVHRIDKVTSGCLLFAKTRGAASELMTKFRERNVDKYYVAVSAGKPSKKQGTVKGDMARTRRSAWKLLRTQDNPAVTSFIQTAFELTDPPSEDGKPPMLRLFLLKPSTGKTHQIRVAMKCLSSPILGDAIYAGNAAKGVDVRLQRRKSKSYLCCRGRISIPTPQG
uniref:Pseudouridine synthase RsuA/RluA-like domain-containing protein n=1 Tax=Guillardia theta (strain CCMP2712) TaxID=905079 RepID=A0A0C3U9Q6_GUITC